MVTITARHGWAIVGAIAISMLLSVGTRADDGLKLPDDFLSLAGQAGLPQYLKCDHETFATNAGVSHGHLQTINTEFYDRDFLLDVVFQYPENNGRAGGLVGIGDGNSDNLAVQIDGNSEHGDVRLHRSYDNNKPEILKLSSMGPHLLRMEKSGDVLTISICSDYNGTFKADAVKKISHFKKASPSLNRLNSPLFLNGDLIYKAIRVLVDGKALDPGPGNTSAEPKIIGVTGLIGLGVGHGLPDYLRPDKDISISEDGLRMHDGQMLRTKATDFIDKDFTLDVVYHRQRNNNSTMTVGIGEIHDGGTWLGGRISGGEDGQIEFTSEQRGGWSDKLGKDHAAGPNLIRLQKRGNTLTLSVCADFKEEFQPDFQATMPDLRAMAPSLNSRNSFLFITDGATIDRMRLVVGKKVVGSETDEAGAATQPGGIGFPAPLLVEFGENKKLPSYLSASEETFSDHDGLQGVVETKNRLPLEKDFTCDVVFKFNKKEGTVRTGLGNAFHGPDGTMHAVYFEANPRHAVCKSPGSPDLDLGDFGDSLGPHLIRFQKVGNILTIAVCEDYKDQIDPVMVKTIPDLKLYAPELTRANSRFFAEGEDITIMEMSLLVDGKPLENVAGNSVLVASKPEMREQTDHVAQPAGVSGGSEFVKGPGPTTQISRKESSIKALYVIEMESGDMLGKASDFILTAASDPDSQSTEVRFTSEVGPQMHMVLQDVLRAICVNYPRWGASKVEFSFEEKYMPHDGGSIGAATGTLILSMIRGFDIDPQLAMTGDVSADGKVRMIGGVGAKLRGAKAADCTLVAMPKENYDQIVDMLIYGGPAAVMDLQIIGISNLDDAAAVARTDRDAKLAKAIELFGEIQDSAGKSPAYIKSKAAQDKLAEVLQLAPEHMSAKVLLAYSQEKLRRRLSATASMYYAFVAANTAIPSIINGIVTNSASKMEVASDCLRQLKQLRPISDIAVQPLVDAYIDYLETMSSYAGSSRRDMSQVLQAKRQAILDAMAKLQADRKFMEKTLHEGI